MKIGLDRSVLLGRRCRERWTLGLSRIARLLCGGQIEEMRGGWGPGQWPFMLLQGECRERWLALGEPEARLL